jgi:hypothetical protein
MASRRDVNVAILDGRHPLARVEQAYGGMALPVATCSFAEVAAVLWLTPGGQEDDFYVQAEVETFERDIHGRWRATGGGGSDWDWPPPGVVPEQDEESGFCLSTPLADGRRLHLIPAWGPSGEHSRQRPNTRTVIRPSCTPRTDLCRPGSSSDPESGADSPQESPKGSEWKAHHESPRPHLEGEPRGVGVPDHLAPRHVADAVPVSP